MWFLRPNRSDTAALNRKTFLSGGFCRDFNGCGFESNQRRCVWKKRKSVKSQKWNAAGALNFRLYFAFPSALFFVNYKTTLTFDPESGARVRVRIQPASLRLTFSFQLFQLGMFWLRRSQTGLDDRGIHPRWSRQSFNADVPIGQAVVTTTPTRGSCRSSVSGNVIAAGVQFQRSTF